MWSCEAQLSGLSRSSRAVLVAFASVALPATIWAQSAPSQPRSLCAGQGCDQLSHSDGIGLEFLVSPQASGAFRASGTGREQLAQLVPADYVTAPAAPLTLTATHARNAEVSAVIGPRGGSVTAKGPDGTTYVLEVPADALKIPTTITIAPLADISGFPLAQPPPNRVGVELRPDGLQFFRPATLTIKPSSPIPRGEVAAMSYRGRGRDASVEFPEISTDTVRLSILHFSGYVLTWPIREPEWRALARQRQESAEARFQSEQSAALALATTSSGDDESARLRDSARLREHARESIPKYVQNVLRPRFEMTGFGCREGRAALDSWFGFWQLLALLGVDDDPEFFPTFDGKTFGGPAELPEEILDNVAIKCLEAAYEHCVGMGDFFALFHELIYIENTAELLGRDTDPWEVQFLRYAQRCGHWKLDSKTKFEATEEATPPNTVVCCVAQGSFDSTIELRWKPGPGNSTFFQILNATIEGMEGEADQSNVQVRVFGAACPHVWTGPSRKGWQAAAKLTELKWEYPDEPGTPDWAATGYPVSLRIGLVPSGVVTSYRCLDISPPHTFEIWSPILGGGDFLIGDADGYPARDWEFMSTHPFRAHKTLTGSGGDATTGKWTTEIDLVLLHTPD